MSKSYLFLKSGCTVPGETVNLTEFGFAHTKNPNQYSDLGWYVHCPAVSPWVKKYLPPGYLLLPSETLHLADM